MAAIMIGLNCSHPDIEEFLHIKETNHKLEHMNISILFTDEFMQAVRDGKDYTCSFFVPETGEKIEKTINAKEFFKRFCKVNWNYGDPGAMFIDTIRKNNLLSGYDDYKIEISNPCFTGDMKLLTTKGYIPFKELEGKTVRVIKPNGEISSKDSPVFKTGTKKVISLMIASTKKSTLKEIKCTPNHIFKTFDGDSVEAKDLKGKRLQIPKINTYTLDEELKVVDIIDNNEVVDVFDFTEYDEHWGVVEGVVAHNCSEFLGAEYTACCLGSINLYNCVDNKFSPNAEFNFEKFNNLVDIGVDALNQVLDYGRDKQPLEANKKAIDDWRNIGLGFFGLADALVALGIRYGSQDAQELLYSIAQIMMMKALDYSATLAQTYGTFRKYDWEKTKKSKTFKILKGALMYKGLYEYVEENGLANGSLISIAPTGTISLLAGGFSGGIEPMFKISYERTTHSLEGKGETFRVFPTSIKELLEYHNLPLTLTNEEIKKKFPYIVEADEIPYAERIEMQRSVQNNIDNAISSTINLPESATPENIFNIYMMAWEAGLKGITVFRDGCMRLSILNPKKKSEDFDNNFGEIVPMRRETNGSLPSLTYKKQSACSKLYPTITFKDGKPFEVFASVTGGCSANIATIVRLSSLALRCGVKPEKLIEELKEQKCPACKTLRGQGRKNISLSCGNAIAESLQEAIAEFNGDFKEKTNIKQPKQTVEVHEERVRKKCPECGAEIRAEGNCISCTQCSWSKCE
jgi:ribonucleotide reductase alpha subunit